MKKYLAWKTQTITDFSEPHVTAQYNNGFVFTRVGKGAMDQTRSLRINLSQFELSSENRRILRKTENLVLNIEPLPYATYSWEIGKLGKDFYDTKFGDGTFSANKIKELITDTAKSNFNALLTYSIPEGTVGYCIAYQNSDILHYCYPFYQLLPTSYKLPPNLGLGMMLKAILWAKEQGKKYVYLGSFQRPTDTYKLQFTGVEWWNGSEWSADSEKLKNIL